MRLPQEIIRTKRDGGPLSEESLSDFVAGLTSGAVSEGQAAALAMAIFLRGMTIDERVALTRAMTRSGTVLSWQLPGPVLDKHSSGGIGDAVSLVLAPLVAACGAFVPMISGRGLGHTGGTLDKLESIPGYDAQPGLDRFQQVVREAGCAIIGQTGDLAPADRRLYAIRDVTGTVESIDLITASILSKKLAAGLDGLVMDVKVGSGAFMADIASARDLASSIVDVASGAGCPTVALITDMDAPLASAAGNAVEIAYAIDWLTGRRREPRFTEVTMALGAEMLVLGRITATVEDARDRLDRALASGQVAERFERMVGALGGPSNLLEAGARSLPAAPVIRPVHPLEDGTVTAIATRQIGLAVIGLGGGRTRPQDAIDHAVGFTRLAECGEEVGPDRPLAILHARDARSADAAEHALRKAYRLGEEAATAGAMILEKRA